MLSSRLETFFGSTPDGAILSSSAAYNPLLEVRKGEWEVRLDRITRHLERIELHVGISNEALAVFVRFWLIR